jgi:hypothetical protein
LKSLGTKKQSNKKNTIMSKDKPIVKALFEEYEELEGRIGFLRELTEKQESRIKELEQQSGLRWVKASERLPEFNGDIIYRVIGTTNQVGFSYKGSRLGFMKIGGGGYRNDFNNIEWLEELEQQLHCKDDLVTGDNNESASVVSLPCTDGNSIEQ